MNNGILSVFKLQTCEDNCAVPSPTYICKIFLKDYLHFKSGIALGV